MIRLACTDVMPECLANLFLCERHLDYVWLRVARNFEAFAQFNNDVSEPAHGRSLPDIDDPFPEHRGTGSRARAKEPQ